MDEVTYAIFTTQREFTVKVGEAVTLRPMEEVLAVRRKAEGEPDADEKRWFLRNIAVLSDLGWTSFSD